MGKELFMNKFSRYDTEKFKVMFIPAKGSFDCKHINLKALEKSGFKKLGLISSIQFVDELEKVKKFLEGEGYDCFVGGQILGCRVEKAYKIKNKVDAFLYIGDGLFHPTALYRTQKPIFLYDGNELKEPKKNKTALLKFLHGEKIGVIVSTKHGQSFMNWTENLKKLFPDKNYYIFLCDTLDYKEMVNFNFIDAWVNTACNRIADDIVAVNYEDIVLLKNSYEDVKEELVNLQKR